MNPEVPQGLAKIIMEGSSRLKIGIKPARSYASFWNDLLPEFRMRTDEKEIAI